MHKASVFIASLLGLLALFGASLWISLIQPGKREPNSAQIAALNQDDAFFLDARDLDFGSAWASASHEHNFQVLNRGPAAITIEGISTTCNCTRISPDSFRLSPGESRQLTAFLDLSPGPGTKAVSRQFSDTEYAFESAFTLNTHRAEQVSFRIHGRVMVPLVAPASISAGTLSDVEEDWNSTRFRVRRHPHIVAVNANIPAHEGHLIEAREESSAEVGVYDILLNMNRPLGRLAFDVECKP